MFHPAEKGTLWHTQQHIPQLTQQFIMQPNQNNPCCRPEHICFFYSSTQSHKHCLSSSPFPKAALDAWCNPDKTTEGMCAMTGFAMVHSWCTWAKLAQLFAHLEWLFACRPTPKANFDRVKQLASLPFTEPLVGQLEQLEQFHQSPAA